MSTMAEVKSKNSLSHPKSLFYNISFYLMALKAIGCACIPLFLKQVLNKGCG